MLTRICLGLAILIMIWLAWELINAPVCDDDGNIVEPEQARRRREALPSEEEGGDGKA